MNCVQRCECIIRPINRGGAPFYDKIRMRHEFDFGVILSSDKKGHYSCENRRNQRHSQSPEQPFYTLVMSCDVGL